jgi:hypothetical protein
LYGFKQMGIEWNKKFNDWVLVSYNLQ